MGHLKLLITVEPKQFETKLEGSEQDISNIEVALTDNRWGMSKNTDFAGHQALSLQLILRS
jgi:hypothetical protein